MSLRRKLLFSCFFHYYYMMQCGETIFLQGNENPEITYDKRDGKYMKQTGVTLPKV